MCNIQERLSNTLFALSYNIIWFCNYLSLKFKKTCNITNECINECLQNDEESNYKSWIGTFILSEDNRLTSELFHDSSIDDMYDSLLKKHSNHYSSDRLFMAKNGEIWNVRTYAHAYTHPLSTTVSEAKFFNIEYIHPGISENIEITIPKSQYIASNDLLSKTYIFNYLRKQSQPYIFDDKYKLQIMDENLNIFEIDSQQYIQLLEGGYTVCNLQTPQ